MRSQQPSSLAFSFFSSSFSPSPAPLLPSKEQKTLPDPDPHPAEGHLHPPEQNRSSKKVDCSPQDWWQRVHPEILPAWDWQQQEGQKQMEQLFAATLPSPLVCHYILGFLENSNADVTESNVTTVYNVMEVGHESCIPDRQTGPGTATGALPHNSQPLLRPLFLTFSNQCFLLHKLVSISNIFVNVRQDQVPLRGRYLTTFILFCFSYLFQINVCFPSDKFPFGTYVKVRQGNIWNPSYIARRQKNLSKAGSIFSLGTLWDTTRYSESTI